MNICDLLAAFIGQSETNDLKTSRYPKDWDGFKLKVSFGMGAPAKVPWIAFTTPEISVSDGFYPVFLYYKTLHTLILSYGVSETNEYQETWPIDITSNFETIQSYLGSENVPRYKGSFVFKAYTVDFEGGEVSFRRKGKTELINNDELSSDLSQMLTQYQQATKFQAYNPSSQLSQGIFYLEKQLEDFIIQNWKVTELGKKYDLIVEDGEIISQQYRTDVGPIDILVKDKDSGSYTVIELKKNQTSDDTIGQIARYMGWVEDKLGDQGVRGIIIAKEYDQKLEYALRRIPGVEVYVYDLNLETPPKSKTR